MIKPLQAAYDHIPAPAKAAMDLVSVFAWISALTGLLTNLVGLAAAVASFAWAAVRFYETKTVQAWLAKRKASKK